jgi:hypothetical protein
MNLPLVLRPEAIKDTAEATGLPPIRRDANPGSPDGKRIAELILFGCRFLCEINTTTSLLSHGAVGAV